MRHRAHKVGQAIDSDALKFLSPGYAYITDLAKRQAIIDAVSAMKDSGLWNYFVGIYPYVSDGIGKARNLQHRYNLKDPDNYNLTILPTYAEPPASDSGSDYGVGPNYVMDSNIPVNIFNDQGHCLGCYYDYKGRSQSGASYDIYGRTATSNGLFLHTSVNNGAQRFSGFDSTSFLQVSHAVTKGFLCGTRENNSSRQALYRDGILRGQNSNAPNYPDDLSEPETIVIGGQFPNPTTNTFAEHRCDIVAYGIPESLMDELDTIVLNYQTALGRA